LFRKLKKKKKPDSRRMTRVDTAYLNGMKRGENLKAQKTLLGMIGVVSRETSANSNLSSGEDQEDPMNSNLSIIKM
jgi:hypothetical protein